MIIPPSTSSSPSSLIEVTARSVLIGFSCSIGCYYGYKYVQYIECQRQHQSPQASSKLDDDCDNRKKQSLVSKTSTWCRERQYDLQKGMNQLFVQRIGIIPPWCWFWCLSFIQLQQQNQMKTLHLQPYSQRQQVSKISFTSLSLAICYASFCLYKWNNCIDENDNNRHQTDIDSEKDKDKGFDVASQEEQESEKSQKQGISNGVESSVSSSLVSSISNNNNMEGTQDNNEKSVTTPSNESTNDNHHYLEMLVHNVSHTDLVLGLDVPDAKSSNATPDESLGNTTYHPMGLCRPRFSAFDMYCCRILQSLQQQRMTTALPLKENIIKFPRYQRSYLDKRLSIKSQPSKAAPIPTGMRVHNDNNQEDSLCIEGQSFNDLRIRGKDMKIIEPYISNQKDEKLHINSIFFPLIATMLPRWNDVLCIKHQNSNNTLPVKKVLVLITGVGTPRNWTHSINGNSTKILGDIMQLFIQTIYPDITVVKLHSDTNIFRYDENILFVQQQLLPTIHAYRDAHAYNLSYPHEKQGSIVTKANASNATDNNAFNIDWRNTFNIILSFADGSFARTNAIQAAIRNEYKPTYFHFWSLKTFWHESKIVDDDIEVYEHEFIETAPAVDIEDTSSLDDATQLVISEMLKFKSSINDQLSTMQHDFYHFWLRKTHKLVLSVLLVEQPDEHGKNRYKIYRGTNMEVSMPTGSLCAERNVIGTALAMNPSLRREDLKLVAVLAVPLPKVTSGSSKKAQLEKHQLGSNKSSDYSVDGLEPKQKHIEKNQGPPKNSASSDGGMKRSSSSICFTSGSGFSDLLTKSGTVTESDSNDNNNNNHNNTDSDWVLQPLPPVTYIENKTSDQRGNLTDGANDMTIPYCQVIKTNLTQNVKNSLANSLATIETDVQVEDKFNSSTATTSSSNSSYNVPGTPPTYRRISLFPRQRSTSLGSEVESNGSGRYKIVNKSREIHSNTRTMKMKSVQSTGNNMDEMEMSNVIDHQHKKTVLIHSAKDLNPLKPCGACNEWLKKIAECNPYFKILTFTDTDCNGVYVQRVQEY